EDASSVAATPIASIFGAGTLSCFIDPAITLDTDECSTHIGSCAPTPSPTSAALSMPPVSSAWSLSASDAFVASPWRVGDSTAITPAPTLYAISPSNCTRLTATDVDEWAYAV